MLEGGALRGEPAGLLLEPEFGQLVAKRLLAALQLQPLLVEAAPGASLTALVPTWTAATGWWLLGASLLTLAGIVLMVCMRMSSFAFTSRHSSGADTGAPGSARTHQGATSSLP